MINRHKKGPTRFPEKGTQGEIEEVSSSLKSPAPFSKCGILELMSFFNAQYKMF